MIISVGPRLGMPEGYRGVGNDRRPPLECVLNVSGNPTPDLVAALRGAAGADLLDLHLDEHHQRVVCTLIGEQAPRRVAVAAIEAVDHRDYTGVHPSLGVVDVVPFVPLGDTPMAEAIAARDRWCAWEAATLDIPAFAYGPDGLTLPEVRRRAFVDLTPSAGPTRPHPTAGATAAGARPPLVAYNLWLAQPNVELAREVARALRGPSLRTLALAVGDGVQVSTNLIDPLALGPAEVYDAVRARVAIDHAELVGLVPQAVLDRVDPARWLELDLGPDKTIEHRLTRPRPGQLDQAEATPPSD